MVAKFRNRQLHRYEMAQQSGREQAKELVQDKFVPTIRFVEDYLCDVHQSWCITDNEQSKLTYEVCVLTYSSPAVIKRCLCFETLFLHGMVV